MNITFLLLVIFFIFNIEMTKPNYVCHFLVPQSSQLQCSLLWCYLSNPTISCSWLTCRKRQLSWCCLCYSTSTIPGLQISCFFNSCKIFLSIPSLLAWYWIFLTTPVSMLNNVHIFAAFPMHLNGSLIQRKESYIVLMYKILLQSCIRFQL